MVSLSTASIVKGPQAGDSAWPNTATDGFLMLAWTLGVKERNEPNWNRPAMLPSAGIAREIISTGEHVKPTPFWFFTHGCQRRWKSSVGCCISGGFCRGKTHEKNSFQWALTVIRFYATCTITGLLLVLKQLHVFVITLLENIDASAACFFSEHSAKDYKCISLKASVLFWFIKMQYFCPRVIGSAQCILVQRFSTFVWTVIEPLVKWLTVLSPQLYEHSF